MSSQELIKFLTREFVQYVETPKDVRKKKKLEKKEQQGNWSNHWFGVLPTALKMIFKRNR
jgi:hypothetical protein